MYCYIIYIQTIISIIPPNISNNINLQSIYAYMYQRMYMMRSCIHGKVFVCILISQVFIPRMCEFAFACRFSVIPNRILIACTFVNAFSANESKFYVSTLYLKIVKLLHERTFRNYSPCPQNRIEWNLKYQIGCPRRQEIIKKSMKAYTWKCQETHVVADQRSNRRGIERECSTAHRVNVLLRKASFIEVI